MKPKEQIITMKNGVKAKIVHIKSIYADNAVNRKKGIAGKEYYRKQCRIIGKGKRGGENDYDPLADEENLRKLQSRRQLIDADNQPDQIYQDRMDNPFGKFADADTMNNVNKKVSTITDIVDNTVGHIPIVGDALSGAMNIGAEIGKKIVELIKPTVTYNPLANTHWETDRRVMPLQEDIIRLRKKYGKDWKKHINDADEMPDEVLAVDNNKLASGKRRRRGGVGISMVDDKRDFRWDENADNVLTGEKGDTIVRWFSEGNNDWVEMSDSELFKNGYNAHDMSVNLP